MGTMDSFDAKKDDWHTYEERLDIYFIANDIPESKKVAVMLSMIGAESYQLLRQLSTPTKPSDMSYSQIVEMLGQHLSPEPRVIPERFRFGKCKQFKKESLQDFVLRLKKQVQHCQYGDGLDEMLRDQFIAGLNLESAQKALLKENDDLTFACAVDITSAHEAAEKEINASKTSDEPKQEQQQQQQQQQKQRQQQQQQQQQKKKGQNRGGPNPQGKEKGESKRKPSDSTGGGDEAKSSGSIRCYRCGKNHHVKECWYPADIICGACKKKGHTEHVCRNKKN